jgi:hypothetical protein
MSRRGLKPRLDITRSGLSDRNGKEVIAMKIKVNVRAGKVRAA